MRNLDITVNNPSHGGVANEQDSIHSARNELSKTVMDFANRKSDMKQRHQDFSQSLAHQNTKFSSKMSETLGKSV